MKQAIEHNNGEEEFTPSLLVVDDEKPIRELIEDFLSLEGFEVKTASDAEEALSLLEKHNFQVMLTDLKMPGMNGIELMEVASARCPTLVTIVMTGYGTLETAVTAMKQGAFDYVLKPFKIEDVLRIVTRALQQAKLLRENISLKETIHIFNASEAISSTLEKKEIYEYVMSALNDVLAPDYAAVYLKRGRKFQPVFSYKTEASPSEREVTERLRIPPMLKLFREKRPCLFHGRKTHGILHTPKGVKEASALTSLPIYTKGEITGFVLALSFTPGKLFREGQRKAMAIIANRAAFAIENATLYENLQELFFQTVESFARAIEAKDKYTHGHSERVRDLAIMTARAMGLPEEEVKFIGQAAILHDIGKLSVDLSRLNYPGKIDRNDMDDFRKHPVVGKEILTPIKSLAPIIPYVYHHHENWDGSGYPEGLKGEEIPLGARILAVADAYDAMTSDRAYRKARSHAKAADELLRYAGKQFDPSVVRAFLVAMEEKLRSKKRAGKR